MVLVVWAGLQACLSASGLFGVARPSRLPWHTADQQVWPEHRSPCLPAGAWGADTAGPLAASPAHTHAARCICCTRVCGCHWRAT
jgi:hypothetical protein